MWRISRRGFDGLWSDPIPARPVEIFPPLAFLDDGFEVFLEDGGILGGILDDGSDHAGGEVVGGQFPGSEMPGEGQAVGHY